MAILGQRRGAQGAVELTTVGAATTGRVPSGAGELMRYRGNGSFSLSESVCRRLKPQAVLEGVQR